MFSVILLLGRKKHCVYAFHPVSDSLGFPAYLIGEVFDHIWFVFFLNYLYVLHGNICVLINDWIGHFGQIV